MKRHIARLGTAVCLLVGVVIAVAPPASAVLPEKVGWFNKLQQVPILPGVGPVNLPLPPVISSDDLPVVADGTPEGLIIAAVRYLVPPGASARLTLVDTNERPILFPPGAAILACPTTKVWDGLINGRWDARPTYDCTALSASSSPTEDRLGFTFDLPAAFQVSPGAIDIALVPSGPLPFAAVFNSPTDDSLVLTNVPDTPEEVQSELSTAPTLTPPADSSSSGSFSVQPFESDGFTAPLPSLGATGSRRMTAGGGETRFAQPTAAPFAIPDSRAERTLAFLILAALGAALFWFGGRPAREPRLLGSLGNGQVPTISAGPVAGVGRFARPRGGRD